MLCFKKDFFYERFVVFLKKFAILLLAAALLLTFAACGAKDGADATELAPGASEPVPDPGKTLTAASGKEHGSSDGTADQPADTAPAEPERPTEPETPAEEPASGELPGWALDFGIGAATSDAPAEAPVDLPSDAGVRFDGFYVSDPDSTNSVVIVRFYPDGDIISYSASAGSLPTGDWFNRDNTERTLIGYYTIDGAGIMFTTCSDNGTVDYVGEILSEEQFVTDSHSNINGNVITGRGFYYCPFSDAPEYIVGD